MNIKFLCLVVLLCVVHVGVSQAQASGRSKDWAAEGNPLVSYIIEDTQQHGRMVCQLDSSGGGPGVCKLY